MLPAFSAFRPPVGPLPPQTPRPLFGQSRYAEIDNIGLAIFQDGMTTLHGTDLVQIDREQALAIKERLSASFWDPFKTETGEGFRDAEHFRTGGYQHSEVHIQRGDIPRVLFQLEEGPPKYALMETVDNPKDTDKLTMDTETLLLVLGRIYNRFANRLIPNDTGREQQSVYEWMRKMQSGPVIIVSRKQLEIFVRLASEGRVA